MSRRNRRQREEIEPVKIETEPWRLEQQARELREKSQAQFEEAVSKLSSDERIAFSNARNVKRRSRSIERSAICLLPGCEAMTIKLAGRSLGICDLHAMPVAHWWAISVDENQQMMLNAGVLADRLHRERAEKKAEERRAETRRTTPGWIYYIQVGERIKIGYSVDPRQRLRQYPPDTPLLALHPGTMQLESEIHSQFTGSRIAGREWFLDTPEIRDHIAAVIDEFGEPDRARYEHRGQNRRTSGFRAG